MIDYRYKYGGEKKDFRFAIEGEVSDLTRETLALVGMVYSAIHDESAEAAEFFKEQIGIYAMNDGFWEVALTKDKED